MTTSTRCALGIDLGTSGVKVVIADRNGDVVSRASAGYPVSSPRHGWAETDPHDWLRAAREAVREAIAAADGAHITSIGIDGQMHGAVLTAADGRPTRAALLWPDTRATDVVGRWRDELSDAGRAALANPLSPGMMGPLAAWVLAHEPEAVDDAQRLLFPKDWLRAQLLPGSLVTDASDASASLLWDLPAGRWHEEALTISGIPSRLLPEVRASTDLAGHLSPEIARTWDLPAGIPVAVGSSDVAATLLGLNAHRAETILIVGTGAQVLVPGIAPEAAIWPRHHTYRSWDSDHYAMGAVTNAGLALQQVVKLSGASWTELYAAAAHSPTAATPVFHPFFTEERFIPGSDRAGASWSGLGLGSERADLLYAALEGVALSIAHGLETVGGANDAVRTVGGGSAQPDFLQLIADVTGRAILPVAGTDATAIGAASLGARAAGEPFATAPAAQKTLPFRPRPRPDIAKRIEERRRHLHIPEDEVRS